MKLYRICGIGAFALALSLVACGDDSSSNSDVNGGKGEVITLADGSGEKVCDEMLEGWVAEAFGKDFRRCQNGEWTKITASEASAEDEIIGGVTVLQSSSSIIEESSSSSAKDSGSVEDSSSSNVIASEAKQSSSSVVSSSSVTSSSSVESSSSVVSSSSEKSSSSVASSSSEKSSSSVASSSSAKSSSSVASSSSSIKVPEPAEGSSSSKANWAYLNPAKTYGTMIDTRDGQVYKTVKIGTQTWMAENLNYDPGDVSSMSDYAWSGCYGDGGYDYSSRKNLTDEEVAANCSKYGRLYTWEVAMDKADCAHGTYCNNSNEGAQGVCPSGWHLPTKEDWQKLVKPMASSVNDYATYWYYNGAGIELKTVDDWYSSSNKGTNASGFSALPAGYRSYDGYFYEAGSYAIFWSASEINGNGYDAYRHGYDAYRLLLFYSNANANLDDHSKKTAYSVRCLKD